MQKKKTIEEKNIKKIYFLFQKKKQCFVEIFYNMSQIGCFFFPN